MTVLTYTSSTLEQAREGRERFQATGEGIVWALVDSGVDSSHPQFQKWKNLEVPAPLQHMDLTTAGGIPSLATDGMGHGTHMAGIICGELTAGGAPVLAEVPVFESIRGEIPERFLVDSMQGIAPRAKIVSLCVLDDRGGGQVSGVLRAVEYIEQMNSGSSELTIHGVCMGIGFGYDVRLFASGQSPLCAAVDRLVKSGVVVVVPTGNTGFQHSRSTYGAEVPIAVEGSINDPGNAELAITVGSAHRLQAEAYGVSYFSAKGPTLDGRPKPDLVAPGERILSCAVRQSEPEGEQALYREQTGTSMAAAHVSGAIAALLSVRRDLIGKPDEVKKLLLSTATDLRRDPNYQGRGLLNLRGALDPQRAAGKASGVARPGKVRVLISYAHEDEALVRSLRTHLAALEARGLIEIWRDRNLIGGDDWHAEILRQIDSSNLIIFLISADFLSSEFCRTVEMPRAMARHRQGSARVVPVLARKVDITGLDISELQTLPQNFEPVKSWGRDREDEAWAEVATGIRRIVESITGTTSDMSPLVPGPA
jgi:serine protease AprX